MKMILLHTSIERATSLGRLTECLFHFLYLPTSNYTELEVGFYSSGSLNIRGDLGRGNKLQYLLQLPKVGLFFHIYNRM